MLASMRPETRLITIYVSYSLDLYTTITAKYVNLSLSQRRVRSSRQAAIFEYIRLTP